MPLGRPCLARPMAPALCWGTSWSPLPQASCSAMTNRMLCPHSIPCAHWTGRSRSAHVLWPVVRGGAPVLQGGCGQPLQCPRQEGRGPGPWTPCLCVGEPGGGGAEGDRGDGPCLGRMNGGETRLLGEGGDICVLAPAEVGGISELTEACDWWSFGSLLYELLTGTVSGGAGCGALVGVTEDRMAWAQYSQPMWGSGCLVLQSLALGLGVLPAQLPLPSSPHRP